MSSIVIVFLVILILGLVIGSVFYYAQLKLAADLRKDDVGNAHGMIGSYADIRQTVLVSTPSNYSRDAMPLTRENVVLLIHVLEGEVNNGGIDQFLFNLSGDYVHETIQAL